MCIFWHCTWWLLIRILYVWLHIIWWDKNVHAAFEKVFFAEIWFSPDILMPRSIHWISKHLFNSIYGVILRCLLCCKWNNGKQWNANPLCSASNQRNLLSKFRQESTIEIVLFKCIVHNSITYYGIEWQTTCMQ